LAVIVLIRTFLSLSIKVEIEGKFPFQKNKAKAKRKVATMFAQEVGANLVDTISNLTVQPMLMKWQ